MSVQYAPMERPLPRGGGMKFLAELCGVSKKFGSVVALDGLDLQVGAGELVALLGPNGAGKSTAIALMMGLQQPDSGSVRLFDMAPNMLDARRRIGVMMQQPLLAAELRVKEHLELVGCYYPHPYAPTEVIELTNIGALANRRYGELSLGQKRQVQFAIAVCGRPELLFLDEPTVGLDLNARETMWKTVRGLVAEDCSMLLTTHHIEEAEALADRVTVLTSGRIIASGSVDAIRSTVERVHIACDTELTQQEVGAWPEVGHVTVDRKRLNISARHAEPIVRRLLAGDRNLRRLEVRPAGLSEAFAELTRGTPQ